ncbi:bifunctional diaminohydroxyphosphoribosylaminopyrimidine deaminase/5-amino-6-(5-phosphoribosylamino)uracil reductase RibD [Parvularcula oceani]|uniref:bifunctional diaminohydroxyphosphoribosylaminopyrimidine deaminase/5-amino-6-(5-phosphoribosylamino)uracil reductase RibD n=1 Tax=Parvularcula oceani TaxID=1247963 RepID=UPI0009DE64FC|nr:bifunctional diaminohydroxyphosphoribosylaminopyrimidine deaminase/5-amino-6-(5-phosphoribosylamino)uracil reductase RibD [Parvularcula oceani]
MTDEADIMRRAIALARRAEGRTSPNPLVGCVLVRDGAIVGEGWHEGPGLPHAEVMALRDAGDAARGAVAYVTLEPCNHTGRTGPCSLALIEAGVSEVVYAVADPNPLAAGGAQRLRSAGIPARQGPCEDEARALIRPWLHGLASDLPWVTAKFAASLDGRTATRTGDSKWITGPEARARSHELRQRCDAVLVGVGTVLADDPSLDPRPQGQEPAPGLKVVLDTHLRTPADARLLTSPGRTLIACGEEADAGKADALRAAGAEVQAFPQGEPLPWERSTSSVSGEGQQRRGSGERIFPSPQITDLDSSRGGGEAAPRTVDLRAVLLALRKRDCLSVMVEGGASVLGSAFDRGLVDEVWAFLAPVIIGGGQPAIAGRGPDTVAEALRLSGAVTETHGPDILIRGLTQRQEAACSLAS